MKLSLSSLRAKRGNLFRLPVGGIDCRVAMLLAMTMWVTPSFAADAPKEQTKPAVVAAPATAAESKPAEETPAAPAPNPSRYAPDFCDFEITFPEKPYTAKNCLPDGETCYDLQSYTMVYDLKTTVDVSVTCNPSTPAAFARYNKTVMKAALAGMVSERHLDNSSINFQEEKDVRSASLSGTGITGAEHKIYTAQLWIGQNSVFTVQAELIGVAQEQADKTFSEILKSIKVKGGKQLPAKPKMPKTKTN